VPQRISQTTRRINSWPRNHSPEGKFTGKTFKKSQNQEEIGRRGYKRGRDLSRKNNKVGLKLSLNMKSVERDTSTQDRLKPDGDLMIQESR